MKALWKSIGDSKAVQTLRSIHEEEDGAMEMKMIMFLALAALIAVLLYKFAGTIWDWISSSWGKASKSGKELEKKTI